MSLWIQCRFCFRWIHKSIKPTEIHNKSFSNIWTKQYRRWYSMQRTLLNKFIYCLIVNYDYKIHVSTFRFCYFVFSAECQYKKWSYYFNRAWQTYVVTDFVIYHMCLSIVAMFLLHEVVKKTMLSLTSWLFLNLNKKNNGVGFLRGRIFIII